MLAYVNGEFIDDSEASISVRDRGFLLGDGVFDAWRTYGGRSVRPVVEKHLERFRRSMNAIELAGDELVSGFDDVTAELTRRSQEDILAVGDVYVFSIVTRGQTKRAVEGFDAGVPTQVVVCYPLPFGAIGPLYEAGVHVVPSMLTQNPFSAHDPRVKSVSRVAYVRAERKQARSGVGHWTAIFDSDGSISEVTAAAICIVEGETVVRPPKERMLPSISLNIFCELAEQLGYKVEERPLAMYDFINADESYILSTGIAFLPIAEIDGIPMRRGDVVGPRILSAWIDLVGFDFVAQARDRASAATA